MCTLPDAGAANPRPIFLTAEWRHLVMMNWEVDPALLAAHVPAGVELDDFEGRTYVSLVGFSFLRTKLKGLAIPCHRDFPEVNLRFYVRREVGGETRRGVVFLKEIVPRRAIASVANRVYGERYACLPMVREVSPDGPAVYGWGRGTSACRMTAEWRGAATAVADGSEEEFITEHFWGYAGRRGGGTTEYQVEHPRWGLLPAARISAQGPLAAHYGEAFGEVMAGPPRSAFLADGSAVVVRSGTRIG